MLFNPCPSNNPKYLAGTHHPHTHTHTYTSQPYKPLLKFFVFKTVIFLTFWQVGLSIYIYTVYARARV